MDTVKLTDLTQAADLETAQVVDIYVKCMTKGTCAAFSFRAHAYNQMLIDANDETFYKRLLLYRKFQSQATIFAE